MSFYMINNHPVFLSIDRENRIKKEVLKDKDPKFRVISVIRGTRESKEAKRKIYKFLLNEYLKDEKIFISEWVNFSFLKEEAGKNVWDLLNAYCCFYGHAYLSPALELPVPQLLDYLYGPMYPMGKIFWINYIINPKDWWWKYKKEVQTVSVSVYTDSVNQLIGNLKQFEVHTKDYTMYCGKNISIIPINWLKGY